MEDCTNTISDEPIKNKCYSQFLWLNCDPRSTTMGALFRR